MNENTWVVLATGPSMSQELADSIKGRCHVVAVSNAYQLAPWADILVSGDDAWWKEHPEALLFKGQKLSVLPVGGVERMSSRYYGRNSGLLGVIAAIDAGAKKVLLCGFDMKGDHYFGKHPAPLKNPGEKQFKMFKRHFAGFRYPADVTVLNCTPGSMLTCFAFSDIETELSNAGTEIQAPLRAQNVRKRPLVWAGSRRLGRREFDSILAGIETIEDSPFKHLTCVMRLKPSYDKEERGTNVASLKALKRLGIKTEIVHGTQALSNRLKSIGSNAFGLNWGTAGVDFRRPVMILELGYIGDRNRKYVSLCYGGLNNRGTFADYPADDGERFKLHGGRIRPWKKTGENILLLGQVRGDSSLQGKDISQWYSSIARKAQDIYNLPVVFRPHPRRGTKGYHSIEGFANSTEKTLEAALDKAYFTIAYNSNACLDSIMYGVPSYAGDMGTIAYDLCFKELDKIKYPAREKRLYKLAYKQFSVEELASGEPFAALIKKMGLLEKVGL